MLAKTSRDGGGKEGGRTKSTKQSASGPSLWPALDTYRCIIANIANITSLPSKRGQVDMNNPALLLNPKAFNKSKAQASKKAEKKDGTSLASLHFKRAAITSLLEKPRNVITCKRQQARANALLLVKYFTLLFLYFTSFSSTSFQQHQQQTTTSTYIVSCSAPSVHHSVAKSSTWLQLTTHLQKRQPTTMADTVR